MQDLVSQVRKEGMISTGIDLFLAVVLVIFKAIGLVSGSMFVIVSGIFIALICFSVVYRLRALRKISKLSGIKAAALYRNCVILCICFVALLLFYPAGCYRDDRRNYMEFSGTRSRNLHNRSVASHKFFACARKRRDDISDLRVALHLLFCAKLAMWRRAFRFG